MFVILRQIYSDFKRFMKSKPKDLKYIALDEQNINK